MISKNFFLSLQDIAQERQLDINELLKKVEFAMGVACKKVDPPYTGDVKVEVDYDKFEFKVIEYKYVVEEIDPENPVKGQITLEDAKAIRSRVKVGDVLKSKVKFESFNRTAASIFKQNLMSGIKELEREAAFDYFNEKVGEIITAKVIKYDLGFITFNVGKGCEAHMPDKEALKGETFTPGESKKVYITKVEKGTKGPKIYLSRGNKEMIKRLFELEIPEIVNGQIEIMGISRDPGSRTKIGVLSVDGSIDAKGACVGPNGSRIKAINEALNGEKIDIFTWRDNPVDLIAEAMLPARVISVMPNEKEKQAVVIVTSEQYSLAIGKSGQNARLAAYAVGWKIDIKKLEDALAEGINFKYNVIPAGMKRH